MGLCLAMVIVSSFAFAQDNYNTYGKSEAEIVAMGWTKWNDFYTNKTSGSTVDMVTANEIYGAVLQHRNDRMLKGLTDEKSVATIKELRTLLTDYAGSAVNMAENRSGGGTIWHIFYAGILPETESVLYAVMGGKSDKVKHARVSDVEKKLADLAHLNAKKGSVDVLPEFKPGDAAKSLATMKKDLKKIARIAAEFDREGSDQVLQFCIRYADTATGNLN